mgnify:FL=1
MSIQKFVSEFQDHLFNQMPLFDRLNIERASKTDYFGAHKNAEEVLERYKESLQFLEENALNVTDEVETILNSLDKKIEKINTYATTIIGINSTENFDNELLTIQPYVLSDLENWETTQKCLLLPILSSYRIVQPYTTLKSGNKGVSKFLLSDEQSTKFISLKKKHTTQLTAVTYLNDDKDKLETVTLAGGLNKLNIILEIPITTRYIIVDYYYETDDELILTPLSFKHEQESYTNLPTYTYEYGDIFAINCNADLPFGCYVTIELSCSFKDINNIEIAHKKMLIPINSDGLAVRPYSEIENETVYGYWLNSVYEEENLDSIPQHAIVTYKPKQEDGVTLFTEAALRLSVKGAKTIEVTPTVHLQSLASSTLTPRILYLTGLTKNG